MPSKLPALIHTHIQRSSSRYGSIKEAEHSISIRQFLLPQVVLLGDFIPSPLYFRPFCPFSEEKRFANGARAAVPAIVVWCLDVYRVCRVVLWS